MYLKFITNFKKQHVLVSTMCCCQAMHTEWRAFRQGRNGPVQISRTVAGADKICISLSMHG